MNTIPLQTFAQQLGVHRTTMFRIAGQNQFMKVVYNGAEYPLLIDGLHPNGKPNYMVCVPDASVEHRAESAHTPNPSREGKTKYAERLSNAVREQIQYLLDCGKTAQEIKDAIGCTLSQVQAIAAKRTKVNPGENIRKGVPAKKIEGIAEVSVEDLKEAITRVKKFYDSVPNKRTLMNAARRACAEALSERSANMVYLDLKYLYLKSYERMHSENWQVVKNYTYFKHTDQKALPKMVYDTYNDVGFNDFWVIDDSKGPSWLQSDEKNKIQMPNIVLIIELKTGKPLGWIIERANITGLMVRHLIYKTALKYGLPKGIIGEHNKTFTSFDSLALMESLYTPEQIARYRAGNVEGFSEFFPEATSPYISGLGRIPTRFGKASIESLFRYIQSEFDAILNPHAFQGVSRETLVHFDLTRSPKERESWMSFEEYKRAFEWFLTSHDFSPEGAIFPLCAKERPHMLASFAKQTGLTPTIANAWNYHSRAFTLRAIPDEHYAKLCLLVYPKHTKKVTRRGMVEITHNGEAHQYYSFKINYLLQGKKIIVVPHNLKPEYAALYTCGEKGEDVKFLDWGVDINYQRNKKELTHVEARMKVSEIRKSTQSEIRDAAQNSERFIPAAPTMQPDESHRLIDVMFESAINKQDNNASAALERTEELLQESLETNVVTDAIRDDVQQYINQYNI